jgi:antitoxin component YwqK of YwqJK toxin-antitoxin module
MNYLPEIFSFISFNLGREFFAEIQLNSYLSLYLSIISIMVSAIIVISLFRFEKEQERREKEQQLMQNKEYVLFILDKSFSQAFKSLQKEPAQFITPVDLDQEFLFKVKSIENLIDEDIFIFLNRIIAKCKETFKAEELYGPSVNKDYAKQLIELITIPAYSIYPYHLGKVQSVKELFNEGTINLYNALAPKNKSKIYSKDKIFDQDENLLLKKENEKIVLYEHNKLICDAVIDEKGIAAGWAKIFDSEGYLLFDGEFENYQRNGQGTEYLPDQIITKQGYWQDGKLFDGYIHDVLLTDEKTLFCDEINYLVKNGDLFSLNNSNKLLVGCLKVENGEQIIDEGTIENALDA